MSRPRAADAGEISIIPQSQQFCQGKSAKIMHKDFSQNLCNLSIVFFDLLGYNNNVRRTEKKPTTKKFLKKIKKSS